MWIFLCHGVAHAGEPYLTQAEVSMALSLLDDEEPGSILDLHSIPHHVATVAPASTAPLASVAEAYSTVFSRCDSKVNWTMRSNIRTVCKQYESLAESWDGLVLRVKDQTHLRRQQEVLDCRQWTVSGFQRGAWLGIRGRQRRQRDAPNGLLQTHREQDMHTLLAMFWKKMQDGKLKQLTWNGDESVFVRWHADATPMLLWFGALQDELMQKARYLIKSTEPDNGRVRWKAVPYSEYKKKYPRASTAVGLCEVLAQTIFVSFTRPSFQGQEELRTIYTAPQILESSTANSYLEAGAVASPDFCSIHGIRKICEKVAWFFLGGFPDGVAANLRMQAYLEMETSDVPNCLMCFGACVQHAFHRIVVQACQEKKLLGHVHAVQVVVSDPSRNALLHEVM